MTEQELFEAYPVLKNVQVEFIRTQIIEAIGKAKRAGKIEALNEFKGQPVEVNKKQSKGKMPEFYLSLSFLDNIIKAL